MKYSGKKINQIQLSSPCNTQISKADLGFRWLWWENSVSWLNDLCADTVSYLTTKIQSECVTTKNDLWLIQFVVVFQFCHGINISLPQHVVWLCRESKSGELVWTMWGKCQVNFQVWLFRFKWFTYTHRWECYLHWHQGGVMSLVKCV